MNFYQFKVTFTLRVNITAIPLWEMHYVQLNISLLLPVWLYRNFCKENSTVLSLPDVPTTYIACTDQLCIQRNKVKPPNFNLTQNWNPCE